MRSSLSNDQRRASSAPSLVSVPATVGEGAGSSPADDGCTHVCGPDAATAPTLATAVSSKKAKKKRAKMGVSGTRLRALRLFGGINRKLLVGSSSSRSFATAGSSSMGGEELDQSAGALYDDGLGGSLSLLALNDEDGGGSDGNPRETGGEARDASSSPPRRESTEGSNTGETSSPAGSTVDQEEMELEEAQRRYDLAVAAVRRGSFEGGEEGERRRSDPSSLLLTVRRSRSELNRAAARYLEGEVRRVRRRSSGEDGGGDPGSDPRLDLADRLRALGQLYDEELGEYGEALRCYVEVLRIESRLLAKGGDRWYSDGGGDHDGRGDFASSLSASIQDTRRTVGRLRYRIHGAVALPADVPLFGPSIPYEQPASRNCRIIVFLLGRT